MNQQLHDMTALKDFGATLDPPAAGPPDELRGRVLAAATQSPRRTWRAPRLRWRLAAVGALAAGLAAALFITQTVQIRGHAPAASAEAAEILHSAALAARADSTTVPQPDQFVFTESLVAWETLSVDADGTQRSKPGTPTIRRIWLSVDGTRDGLLRERPRSSTGGWTETGLPACPEAKGAVVPTPPACRPIPAYRNDLPTDATGMLAYLNAHSPSKDKDSVKGDPTLRARALFTTVGDTLREAYLPARARAALFEAAARIPGVSVVHGVADAAGRPAVAVGVADRDGGRIDLLFDPRTHDLLGEREVVGRDRSTARKGTVLQNETVLRVAIVNRAGQLPR
jgi:hypothetical protein